MIKNLTSLEKSFIESKKNIGNIDQNNAFSIFCFNRDAQLKHTFPDKPADENFRKLQNVAEFIQSLNFFHPAYIDNLIIYLELLANRNSLFDRDYLISIIDRNICPKGNFTKSGVLNEVMAGYFIYSVSREDLKSKKASVGAATRAMYKTIPLDERIIKKAYAKIKKGFDQLVENKEDVGTISMALDAFCIFFLYLKDFDLLTLKEQVGDHHHTQKEHVKLINAYQEVGDRVAYALVDQVASGFEKKLPYFMETFTPELFQKVETFEKNKTHFSASEVTGLVWARILLGLYPNIVADQELAKNFPL